MSALRSSVSGRVAGILRSTWRLRRPSSVLRSASIEMALKMRVADGDYRFARIQSEGDGARSLFQWALATNPEPKIERPRNRRSWPRHWCGPASPIGRATHVSSRPASRSAHGGLLVIDVSASTLAGRRTSGIGDDYRRSRSVFRLRCIIGAAAAKPAPRDSPASSPTCSICWWSAWRRDLDCRSDQDGRRRNRASGAGNRHTNSRWSRSKLRRAARSARRCAIWPTGRQSRTSSRWPRRMIQSEQLGSQIGPALRSSSDSLRTTRDVSRRRGRAENHDQDSVPAGTFHLARDDDRDRGARDDRDHESDE